MEEQFLLLLSRLQRRLRWVAAFQKGLSWGLWGCWLSLLAALYLKVLDSPQEDLWNALWVGVTVALCGFCLSWSRPPSLKRVALLTDQRQDLKERLVSVLEQQQSWRPKTSVAQFLLQDALKALQSIDPIGTFPNHCYGPMARLLLPLLFVTLVNVSPSWSSWLYKVPEADRQAIRRSGTRLDDLAKRLREQNPNSPRAQRLSSRLEQLAKKLHKPGTDRTTAANELEQAIRQLRRERESSRGLAASNRAKGADRGLNSAALQRLAQQARAGTGGAALEDLHKAIEKATPGSAEEKKLKEAEKKLAQGNNKDAAQDLDELAQQKKEGEQKGQGEQQDDKVADQAEDGLLAENESLEPGNRQLRKNRPGQGPGQPGDKPGDEPGVAMNQAGGLGDKDSPNGTTKEGDFGKGTTDEEQKGQGGHKPRVVRQADNKPTWQEAYKKLYGAERKHFQTADTNVKGQRDKGRLLPSQGVGWGQPNAGGQSKISAEQSFLESKADAEQAMAQGTIPGPYRDVVRNYFQQIDPRGNP